MSSFGRTRLNFDLFGGGLPDDLATPLELEPPWLLLNTPIEMLGSEPGEGLPNTIDLVGGRLVPRPGADMSQCQRSAQFHFGGDDQEEQRRRVATELALSRGLLVPDVLSVFAVQFCLPCDRREVDQLARTIGDIGFARVIILVGKDSTETSDSAEGYAVVRSHVEDEDGALRLVVDGASQGIVTMRDRRASERLRSRLSRLITKMHVPRRTPVVINMSPSGQ